MWMTVYPGTTFVTSGRSVDVSWEAFCKRIVNPFPLQRITLAEYRLLKDDYVKRKYKEAAGGAVYGRMQNLPEGVKSGRKDAYFPTRSAIAYDYEHCDDTIFEKIADGLKDITYCLYTTCTHNPPEDNRLRLIVPFAHEVDWQLYTIMAVILARRIDTEHLDKSCLGRSHMQLFTAGLAGSEYKYNVHNVGNDGVTEFLDVENYLLKNYATLNVTALTKILEIDWQEWRQPELRKLTKPKKLFVSVTGKKMNLPVRKIKNGEAIPKDIKSCFNSCFSCWEIIDMSPEYERFGSDRYTHRGGEGKGGVWVSPDGSVCFSHHANSGDKLYGRGHTACDCYIALFTDDRKSYGERLRDAHIYALRVKGEKYRRKFVGFKIGW